MRTSAMLRLAGGGFLACLGLTGVAVVPASASAQTFDATGTPFDLGPSPVGLPANCPFPNGDANFLFLSGHGVGHDTSNKNGDWGGETITGTAQFFEDSTLIDVGQLTLWEGGGNNAKGQNEGGLTLNFSGSSVTIHVNAHQTQSASGNSVGNALNVQVTCS